MNFKIELLEQEINVVLTALVNQPFKEVAQLINKIQVSAQEQIEANKVAEIDTTK